MFHGRAPFPPFRILCNVVNPNLPPDKSRGTHPAHALDKVTGRGSGQPTSGSIAGCGGQYMTRPVARLRAVAPPRLWAVRARGLAKVYHPGTVNGGQGPPKNQIGCAGMNRRLGADVAGHTRQGCYFRTGTAQSFGRGRLYRRGKFRMTGGGIYGGLSGWSDCVSDSAPRHRGGGMGWPKPYQGTVRRMLESNPHADREHIPIKNHIGSTGILVVRSSLEQVVTDMHIEHLVNRNPQGEESL